MNKTVDRSKMQEQSDDSHITTLESLKSVIPGKINPRNSGGS